MNRQGCGSPPTAFARHVWRSEPLSFSLCFSEQGATLIEVLVTLVLVAIGLSGMMTMQARGIQQNQSAYLRTQAITIANDVADRLRLNSQAGLDDYYSLALSQEASDFSIDGIYDSSKKLAYADLNGWLNWLSTTLPEGDAEITRTGQRITIVIHWNARRDRGGISSYLHEVDL
ncbi:type IV pilus modification protein PilV [uncultured Amphritea sp.]|uniref:type IV pilus modification protein PilV n=1 Tax=uncultured Amphritea sp. TaxID=981605 RepID=UPI0025DA2E58|nr:type IV pilus modification protein PilV [uncultured Amphritea sp.]